MKQIWSVACKYNIKPSESLLHEYVHANMEKARNANNLSNIDTVGADKLLHSSLNQLRQVAINFIHAHAIQLVETEKQHSTVPRHSAEIMLLNIPTPWPKQFSE